MKSIYLLGIIFLSTIGCQTVQPTEKSDSQSKEHVQKQITDQLNKWKQGISKRNISDIMAIFSKDVKGYYLGLGEVDFTTIQNNYRESFLETSMQTTYSFEIMSIHVSGEIAVLSIGYSWKSTEKTTNESMEGTDRSMEVWTLFANQEWKMIEFILITE